MTIRIMRDWARAKKTLLARFEDKRTGNICDAQGRTGALHYRIKAVSTRVRFCGSAIPVDAGPRDNLAAWAALEVVEPGDVLVIATGDHVGASVTGDLMVGMAKNRGIRAVVTDGVVRDVPGIEETELPVFARGVSPNSPWKNGPGTVGLPIVVGGVAVRAGDIVVGDGDGVVVVSLDEAERIADALDIVVEKEANMDAQVANGLQIPQWLIEARATMGFTYVKD